MPTFNDINNININGNNYDRTRCIIEISGISISTTDITSYVKGISYSETPDIQFDYSLGSRRPTNVGFGNITCEGTLTVSDAGLAKLNEIAVNASLPSMSYLGQNGGVNLTISYVTYNNKTKTDILEQVYFTKYENGVNTSDVIYEREITLMVGKINIGGIL